MPASGWAMPKQIVYCQWKLQSYIVKERWGHPSSYEVFVRAPVVNDNVGNQNSPRAVTLIARKLKRTLLPLIVAVAAIPSGVAGAGREPSQDAPPIGRSGARWWFIVEPLVEKNRRSGETSILLELRPQSSSDQHQERANCLAHRSWPLKSCDGVGLETKGWSCGAAVALMCTPLRSQSGPERNEEDRALVRRRRRRAHCNDDEEVNTPGDPHNFD
ncbi:hypothetical protein BXZ70DRAFT_911541 [Cristinia sonorae]|uniref:Uncharacterized protein n=1 Tax=Cristinia sonorae TaxID=1940300 RepID=A0A8K0UDZ3_9AGAR|nr:hypothetical protein BXZ70DRAFT_911541 [Cristinia sonorae]